MNLFLFCFGTIGMTMILVDSKAGHWIRGWNIWVKINNLCFKKFSWVESMLDCHLCTGFWCGLICSAFTITNWEAGWWNISNVFLGGCTGSIISYFAALFLTYLEANSIVGSE